jgi:hypothetical protein
MLHHHVANQRGNHTVIAVMALLPWNLRLTLRMQPAVLSSGRTMPELAGCSAALAMQQHHTKPLAENASQPNCKHDVV